MRCTKGPLVQRGLAAKPTGGLTTPPSPAATPPLAQGRLFGGATQGHPSGLLRKPPPLKGRLLGVRGDGRPMVAPTELFGGAGYLRIATAASGLAMTGVLKGHVIAKERQRLWRSVLFWDIYGLPRRAVGPPRNDMRCLGVQGDGTIRCGRKRQRKQDIPLPHPVFL